MSALSIQPTYPIFSETDGQPLENGYIWIGTVNLDPQGNPINVYWDALLTQPAAQPIRTLNGYPSRNGTPARMYVNSDYSIRVMNKNGSVVYSAPAATERYSDVVVSSINAENVVYDPPFGGGVPTNAEAWMAKAVRVTDFGAVGDGVTDDTAAIQAALTYQANNQISTQDGAGNFLGTSPDIFFPKGRYLISSTLNWTSSYGKLIGEQAIISEAGGFAGNYAIENTTGAWRVSVHGIQFEDFHTAVYLDNANQNSGQIEFVECGFFNHVNGARIVCQSSIVVFQDCMWRSCEHEIWQENCDYLVVLGGWISRGVLTQNGDGGIVVDAGNLDMYSTVGVPTAQTASECAWIRLGVDAQMVRCYSVRFGGETGAHSAVNVYAPWASVDKKVGVELTNCQVYTANTENRCAIRLFNIPNVINLIGNTGFEDTSYIAWSNTVGAGAQATIIAAITAFYVNNNYVLITLQGNSQAYLNPGFGIPLYPGNIAFLLNEESGTWTPTVQSGTGTLTTVTGAVGRYSRIGRQVTVEVEFTITTNGTGATFVQALGLPYVPANQTSGSGIVPALGKSLTVSATSGFGILMRFSDGTYPGADGNNFVAQVTYTRV
jgi:hypothetical protein